MRFARWLLFFAGVYGLLVLTPQYFLENRIAAEQPPAITHPEYFYGFTGVALAWQVAFLVMALDPVRFRPLLIPAVLEKFSFAGAVALLFAQGRVGGAVVAFGAIDFALGCAFLCAFAATGRLRPIG